MELQKENLSLNEMIQKMVKNNRQVLKDTIERKDIVINDLKLELIRQGKFTLLKFTYLLRDDK